MEELRAIAKEYKSVMTPRVDSEGKPLGPPNREEDTVIPLKEGYSVPYRKLRGMTPAQITMVTEEINKLLESKAIQPSSSEFGANTMFVPKLTARFEWLWTTVTLTTSR